MYDTSGNPITISLALFYSLLVLRLLFDFHIQLWDIAANFLRKAGRK
ncbi:MAG TPA: hypothetical protein VLS45_01485 [Methylomicrobium sp.]|nr:hypothetical protein [Methylomicrobium sp.]